MRIEHEPALAEILRKRKVNRRLSYDARQRAKEEYTRWTLYHVSQEPDGKGIVPLLAVGLFALGTITAALWLVFAALAGKMATVIH